MGRVHMVIILAICARFHVVFTSEALFTTESQILKTNEDSAYTSTEAVNNKDLQTVNVDKVSATESLEGAVTDVNPTFTENESIFITNNSPDNIDQSNKGDVSPSTVDKNIHPEKTTTPYADRTPFAPQPITLPSSGKEPCVCPLQPDKASLGAGEIVALVLAVLLLGMIICVIVVVVRKRRNSMSLDYEPDDYYKDYEDYTVQPDYDEGDAVPGTTWETSYVIDVTIPTEQEDIPSSHDETNKMNEEEQELTSSPLIDHATNQIDKEELPKTPIRDHENNISETSSLRSDNETNNVNVTKKTIADTMVTNTTNILPTPAEDKESNVTIPMEDRTIPIATNDTNDDVTSKLVADTTQTGIDNLLPTTEDEVHNDEMKQKKGNDS